MTAPRAYLIFIQDFVHGAACKHVKARPAGKVAHEAKAVHATVFVDGHGVDKRDHLCVK